MAPTEAVVEGNLKPSRCAPPSPARSARPSAIPLLASSHGFPARRQRNTARIHLCAPFHCVLASGVKLSADLIQPTGVRMLLTDCRISRAAARRSLNLMSIKCQSKYPGVRFRPCLAQWVARLASLAYVIVYGEGANHGVVLSGLFATTFYAEKLLRIIPPLNRSALSTPDVTCTRGYSCVHLLSPYHLT